MGTIIVGLMVAGIVFLIVASLVKSKRTGKNSCGCGCEDCLMSNGCKMKVKAK
jgi:hypothetical protein